MRLFVAVELPAEQKQTIARGLERLRRDLHPARWARPDGIHVTLKFLGEQPPDFGERLEAAVTPELAPLTPVTVVLGGGGFFPHARRPRVAWLGGRADGLERWAAAFETAAAGLGVDREGRPFALHLTLARLERPWQAPAVERFLGEVGDWRISPFEAREAVLFASDLRPGGAVYTALRRWRVGGG